MNNFSFALVNATNSIRKLSSSTSSSKSMLTVEKIESTITSMKLVLAPPEDGEKITKSNARPFALCTVVSVTGA